MANENLLIKNESLVSKNTHQFAVFYTGTKNIYAINIAKVKAFIITQDVSINDVPSDTPVISGIATIRGEPITLVNLDTWLGNKSLHRDEYKLIVYCEFNRQKIGILVKEMIDIVEKQTSELKYAQDENTKTSYSTYVKVNGKDEYCVVFNAEQLLNDIGFKCDNSDISVFKQNPIRTNKLILIAEDSTVSRDILTKFLQAISANYEIYNNGAELLQRVEVLPSEEIGLIITDIEMPIADGYEVAKTLKSKPYLSQIPIIVNSSMATDAVKNELIKIGVEGFVEKTDLETLYKTIQNVMVK